MGVGLGAAGVLAARSAVRRTAAHHRAHDPTRERTPTPSTSTTLGVRVHTLPSHDGGEIHVVEKGPDDGRPLVLLHGITLAARVWGYQLRDLSDRFRVLAVDLRGHGVVDGRATPGSASTLLAEDLRTMLEALDLREAIVVGHSMGGMTLMQFCGDHPDVLDERVAGVVFLATAPVDPAARSCVQRALRRLSPAIQRRGDRRGWDSHGPLPHGRERPVVRPRPARLRPQPVAHARRAHRQLGGRLRAGDDCSRRASASSCTTPRRRSPRRRRRRSSSAASSTTSRRSRCSRRIAELLPDAELHVLPDAGHQLMLERPHGARRPARPLRQAPAAS